MSLHLCKCNPKHTRELILSLCLCFTLNVKVFPAKENKPTTKIIELNMQQQRHIRERFYSFFLYSNLKLLFFVRVVTIR